MITGTSSRCLRPRGWDLGSEQSCRVTGVGVERWRHLSAPVQWGEGSAGGLTRVLFRSGMLAPPISEGLGASSALLSD